MLPKLTVEGRLTAAPSLRFATSGTAVVSFSVVCNDRKKNDATGDWEDVNPTFFRCTAFKKLAENIAESLVKGDLVIITGKLQQEKYTNKDGAEVSSYQNIIVDMAGPSLAFATAKVQRAERASSGEAAPAPMVDPWATPAAAGTDEPPF